MIPMEAATQRVAYTVGFTLPEINILNIFCRCIRYFPFCLHPGELYPGVGAVLGRLGLVLGPHHRVAALHVQRPDNTFLK